MTPLSEGELRGLNPDRLLAEGLRLHQAGLLAAARPYYQRILELKPRHADALHLLGLVAHQTGDHAAGAELIRRAIRQNDRVATFHNSLGECWRELKEWDRATACYLRALRLDPRSADAHANLGTTLKNQGKFQEAITAYLKSLECRPNDPRNMANLAAAYCEDGQYAEALRWAQEAARLAPNLFEAVLNLGYALRKLGRNHAAVEVLRRAVELRKSDVNALNNLGIAASQVGGWQEAVQAFQTAVQFDPGDHQALLNLGNTWRELHHFDRAEHCYQKALELRPDLAQVWNNLGLNAHNQGLLPRAVECLRRSIELEPKNSAALNNLGGVWREMADPVQALACYREAAALGSGLNKAAGNVIFMLQFCSDISAVEICAEAVKWGDAMIAANRFDPPRNRAPRMPGTRLRVGYLSPDFRSHPVAYFMAGLLQYHDRAKFEVFCYSDVSSEDEWTRRLNAMVEHWIPVCGMADEELTERLFRDDIDLLVDLAGHTAKHRLAVFASKPARVQATYLGYPGSTGLRTVDFRISDRFADPPEESVGHYVERLEVLDRCAWCYEPPLRGPHATTPPSMGQGAITFGCFNNYAKISGEILEVWSKLLREVENSRLLLKRNVFKDVEFGRITRERFQAHGISPERLVLVASEGGMAEHFRQHDAVDIALDTFPYHGTTTTCDALWMGVPVVTWRGDRHASRVGASLLQAVGLAELIAESGDDYVAKAAALAREPKRLAELRATIRERMEKSELMDAVGFARSFEAAIMRMVATETVRSG